jgi:hypothetical protein
VSASDADPDPRRTAKNAVDCGSDVFAIEHFDMIVEK